MRPRFPEFVYSWFDGVPQDQIAPQQSQLQKGSGIPGAAAATDAAKQRAARDEDRWAFYYCIRTLARDYAEAKLFYNFLDEKYGEDELTFYLYW